MRALAMGSRSCENPSHLKRPASALSMSMRESGKEQLKVVEQQKKIPVPVTSELKAQCIQEALDLGNAAAVARRHEAGGGKSPSEGAVGG